MAGLLSLTQLDAFLAALWTVRDEVRPGATAGVYAQAGQGRNDDPDIDRWFAGLLSPAQLDAFLGALWMMRDEVPPGATAGVYSRAGQGQE